MSGPLPSDEELTLPVWVRLAAGCLALAGGFLFVLTAQIALITEWGDPSRRNQVFALWLGLGVAAWVSAGYVAKGHAAAVVAGLLVTVAIALSASLPILMNTVPMSAIIAIGAALLGFVLLLLSYGPCRRAAAARRRLLED